MRIVILFCAAAFLFGACGGSGSSGVGTPPPTQAPSATPPLATAAPSPDRITLNGETYVYARTLPAAALSGETLKAAGSAVAADGSSTEVVRGDTKDLAPWELASLASDGWRVWWPSAVVNALATAGPGATLVSVARVEWSDACLGLPHPGAACLQVITAGYAIIVEQGGQRAEYHASISGALGKAP